MRPASPGCGCTRSGTRSDNADAQIWALMMLLTAGLLLVPFIPGVRSIPRLIPIHRLIWRDYYRRTKKA